MDEKPSLLDDMLTSRERFINPYTDFGFKKLFGTEMNKDLLISFLNALLGDQCPEVVDLEYLNGEQLGEAYNDRRAIFDVYCQTKDGSRFIVEMQKAEQSYFKDRSIYYSTFAIREQGFKGKKWNYRLDNVYTIGILNFTFPESEYAADSFRHEIKLSDIEDHHVFYDKLTFIYLEIPKFNKTENELTSMFDKWMFVLRNLSRLLNRPEALQERVFKKLFDQAEIAQYSPKEQREYAESIKNYWDYFSTMETAHNKGISEGFEQGHAKGLEEGIEQGHAKGLEEGIEQGSKKIRYELARKMKADGVPFDTIAKYTGMTISEVEDI